MVKILFLAANPTDEVKLRLGREIDDIKEKLQLAKMREYFVIEDRMCVRPGDFSQALHDVQPDIVHFSGHGTQTGEICVVGEQGKTHTIQPDALAALFKLVSDKVKCVILNACYLEKQAKAIVKYIDYVIGMKQIISDEAALAFSMGFYKALGAGCSIKESFEFGLVEIGLYNIPEHLTPILLEK